MEKYRLSKAIGVVLGILTIIVTLGYGFLYLLGTSLGKALHSEIDSSATDRLTLVILIGLLIVGVITGAGSFWLNRNVWRVVYFGFCLVLGICLFVTFFISIGALGSIYEFMILCISMMYFLLSYLVRKGK
ncbi:hypothetical protein CN326_15105 [Bacillus sp. AFS018417]|uniref:hypothetical protein n=1 Tax=unclassified Bacillus (in: firmicutes) TaxID=185979 RepID=UPI000BF5BDF2|nr:MULTISPECIES: hypothetical protein [unclassified Bacillus (in: firmicutes)]MCP1123803.1 hypothetical protein [Bacillus sp. 3103sda1]PEZ05071.1 hypothetical protein CN326_15105 [Bacillus sp. AFS018417]